MGIDVLIVKSDLKTKHALIIDSIETEKEFCEDMQSKASALGCIFIQTIDPYGVTLINHLQADLLEKEIKALRAYHELDQSILDILQRAVQEARLNAGYIFFSGD